MTFINLYINKYKLLNMCAVLEISKRIYYKYKNADDLDYLDYKMIKKVFDDSKGTYGYRRITEGLKIEYGAIYNHKKVARIMRKYNIKPEYIRRIRPNLLKRNFNTDTLNKVWNTDITYLILKEKDYIYLQLLIYMIDMYLHIKYLNLIIIN